MTELLAQKNSVLLQDARTFTVDAKDNESTEMK